MVQFSLGYDSYPQLRGCASYNHRRLLRIRHCPEELEEVDALDRRSLDSEHRFGDPAVSADA